MSAAHTPGPWRIVPYGDGETLVIHYSQSQQRVCFMATPSSVTDDFPRIKANARLIAAAPALLEALEEFSREYDGFQDGDGHPCPTLAKARAAISQAKGEAA